VSPPEAVRGMTELDNAVFVKRATLPCLHIKAERLSSVKKALEKYAVKIINFKTVQDTEKAGYKCVVLNPSLVSSFKDLQDVESTLTENEVEAGDLVDQQFTLDGSNWKPHEKLKSILPEDEESVTGFSRIGHVVHLNLKDNLRSYKTVIGQVLLEMKGIRTVVTKTSNIDNTYRNFEFEVLAGDNDLDVTVKENGVSFSFNFSKVYWNPRLSTEHERIVNRLGPNSILFDACAGVGPFSIPAAKKCRVFANDLNPDSFNALELNAKKNKIKKDRITCFNLDAREFIRTVFVEQLASLVKNGEGTKDIHVTMNLPALAVTFLDVFQGLLVGREELDVEGLPLPLVHVYTFSKAEDCVAEVQERVEEYLGSSLDSAHLEGVAYVRNVAPNKEMMRASFKVPRSVLFNKTVGKRKEGFSDDNLAAKKIR